MIEAVLNLGYTAMLVCADSQALVFVVRESKEAWEGQRLTQDGYSRKVEKYDKAIWSRAAP